MKRRPTAVVLVLGIAALTAATLPCCAQGETESGAPDVTRYVGLVTWFPLDRDIWDLGYAIRFHNGRGRGYFTGALGLAMPEAAGVQRGTEIESTKSRLFAGVGGGVRLAQWGNGASFVGAGATLYWVEGGPGGPGWVYVNQALNVLGPADDDTVFLSPEIIAHVQLNRKMGVYLCWNLGSEGLAPRKGIYFGMSLR